MPRVLQIALTGLLFLTGLPAAADLLAPGVFADQQVILQPEQDQNRYGLYVRAATDQGCRVRRFVVLDGTGRQIGATGPLQGGQSAIVTLGREDVRRGEVVTIRTMGCTDIAAEMRLVRLQKPSPDLGNSAAVARTKKASVRIAAVVPQESPHLVTGKVAMQPAIGRSMMAALPPAGYVEDRRRCRKKCLDVLVLLPAPG